MLFFECIQKDFNIGELSPKEQLNSKMQLFIIFPSGELNLKSIIKAWEPPGNEWMNEHLYFTSNKIKTSNYQVKGDFWANLLKIMISMAQKIWKFPLLTKKYIRGSWINQKWIFSWGFQSKGNDFLKMPKDYNFHLVLSLI